MSTTETSSPVEASGGGASRRYASHPDEIQALRSCRACGARLEGDNYRVHLMGISLVRLCLICAAQVELEARG